MPPKTKVAKIKIKKCICWLIIFLISITSISSLTSTILAKETTNYTEANVPIEQTTEIKEVVVSNSEETSIVTKEDLFIFDESKGIITGYKGGANVVIPKQINGKAVKAIGDGAFQNKNLTSVTFSEGLENIGRFAFRDNFIANLILPDTIKTIGWEAFVNAGIQTLKIPDTMNEIPAESFGRNPIVSLTIPDSVESIGRFAFHNCQIQTITWGNGIKKIGNNAFQYNKLKDLIIPAEIIEESAFYDNPLESVTLLDSVKTVGDYAFLRNGNNPTLKSINLGNGVEHIGGDAFYYGITESISLPKSLKTGGTETFSNQKLPYIETNPENPKTNYGNQKLDLKTINKKQNESTVAVDLKDLYAGIDTSKIEIKKVTSGSTSRELPFTYNKSTGQLDINDVNVSYITLYYSYTNEGTVVLTVEQKFAFTNILAVKWNDHDGSNIQTDTYTRDYNKPFITVNELQHPRRNGYTFSAWHKDPFYVGHSLFEIEWSTTYTAIYDANSYNVEYDLNYEVDQSPPSVIKKFQWEDKNINNYNPERLGYTFEGWYYNDLKIENSDSISSIVNQDPGNEATITLTAKWKKLKPIPTIQANDVVLTVGDVFDPIKDTNVFAFDEINNELAITEANIVFNNVNTAVPGTYYITFEVANKDGITNSKTVTVTVNPKAEIILTMPIIIANSKVITVGDVFDPLSKVVAFDLKDGIITLTDKNIAQNNVNTNQAGKYSVIYRVTNSSGLTSTKKITVEVKEKQVATPPLDKPQQNNNVSSQTPIISNGSEPNKIPQTGDKTSFSYFLGGLFISSIIILTGLKKK